MRPSAANPFQVHDLLGQLYVEEFKRFQATQQTAGGDAARTPLLEVVLSVVYDKGSHIRKGQHASTQRAVKFFRPDEAQGSNRCGLQHQALNGLIAALSARSLLTALLTSQQVKQVRGFYEIFTFDPENGHSDFMINEYDKMRSQADVVATVLLVVNAIVESLGSEANKLPTHPDIISLAKFQAPALARLKQVHQQQRVRLSFLNHFGRRKDSPLNAADLATAVERIRARVDGDHNSVGVEEAAQSASRGTVAQFSNS